MSATSAPDSTRRGGLFTREWVPTSRPRGAFLMLHGMESHSAWFIETATRLVADGWAVFAYDRAGWGKSPGQRGHLAHYRHFVEEASLMADAVREKYGSVHLAGMSWGGMAALYLALRRGWLFDSLTLLAPGLASHKDIPFLGKLALAGAFLRGDFNRMVVPAFKPEDFVRDAGWREYVAADSDRVRSVSLSFCRETLKMRRFISEQAGRRRLPPALCLLAGKDAIVNNRAVEKICADAGIRTETLADTAHSLVLDNPPETAAKMSAHAAAAVSAEAPDSNIWIVGGGAVGGAVGSLLAFGGRKTSILVKPSHLDALRQGGYTLRSGNALRNTGASLGLAASPDDLPPYPDLVIVAVKSFDTEQALAGLAGHIPPETVIASIQNGLGNEGKIQEAFPKNTIVASSICASLELAAPGKIIWPDDRGGLAGALHHGDPLLARNVWLGALRATGMECRWIDGVNASQRVKWSKLMLNIGFNALNSITGLSSTELLRDRTYGPLAVQALREGFALMRAMSLEPVDLPGFPVSKMRFLLKAPRSIVQKLMAWQAERSTEAAFSMRQDVLKKRQHTEINELNGMIIRIGQRFSLESPANKKLVEMVEYSE